MKTQEQKLREWTELVRPGKQIEIDKGVISSGGGSASEVIEYEAINVNANIANVDTVKLNKINDNCGILTGQFVASTNIGSGQKLFDIDCGNIGLAGGGHLLVGDGTANIQAVLNYCAGLTTVMSRYAVNASAGTLIRFCFPVMFFETGASDGDLGLQ